MFPHFQRLYDDLPLVHESVSALESPNAEDDRPTKFAIVGYSYHRPVEAWGREEFEFVSHRRLEVEGFAPRWVEFVCLASGYILGLHQAKLCSNSERALFEAQLPGFMWLNAERFEDD